MRRPTSLLIEVRMQVMHRLHLRATRMASKGLHAARINTGTLYSESSQRQIDR